jgi:L-amino acid N-acyltransferase YncA
MLELDVPAIDSEEATRGVELRDLEAADWDAVANIYWDGIRDGLASFETAIPSWEEWAAEHPAGLRLVAEAGFAIAGWIAAAPVSTRRAYRGVVEHSVYVATDWRRKGIGRLLLEGLIERTEAAGIWTIQTNVFPENGASLALHLSCGFREVGARERIGKRDGLWRDTVLLERRSPRIA